MDFVLGQGGLQLHATVGVDALVEQPVPGEKGGGALGAVQRLCGPVDLEHAAGGAVIGDRGFGADLLQGLQGMKRQMEVGLGVLSKSLRGAVAGEFDAPAQDMRYRAVAQEERGILLAQPFDDLHRHAGLGPGLDLAGMDDAAVSPAGFHGRAGLAVEQHHLVTGFPEIPGRGRAHRTRAENNCGHGSPFPSASTVLRLLARFALGRRSFHRFAQLIPSSGFGDPHGFPFALDPAGHIAGDLTQDLVR